MAIQNPYDHALKILARTWPEQFLQLGFPGQPMRLIGTLSNVELALEIDRVDFLHEIELQGTRAYLHIDFQLEHDDSCPRRFFVYNGMLTELEKPTPVITLPIYLRPRVKELPDRYEVKVGDVLFHCFTYQPIKLWTYVEQIRSGELYVFAPLLPVLTQTTDEALLMEERNLILAREPDSDRQRTLLTTAILIAAQSKLYTPDFLWTLFKEDPMDLDNPVIAKLFERAYGERLEAANQRALAAEGKAEAERREAEAARREAEAESKAAQQWQETVFKILEHRFQSIPVALAVLLQTWPAAHRSRVIDLVLDAPTAEECLQALKDLLNAKTEA